MVCSGGQDVFRIGVAFQDVQLGGTRGSESEHITGFQGDDGTVHEWHANVTVSDIEHVSDPLRIQTDIAGDLIVVEVPG